MHYEDTRSKMDCVTKLFDRRTLKSHFSVLGMQKTLLTLLGAVKFFLRGYLKVQIYKF